MAATPNPTARRDRFALQVLIGVIAGIVLGLIARATGPVDAPATGALGHALDLVGQSFIALLRALVPPLVFTAIVASIANLRSLDGVGGGAAGLAWRTLMWFAITAAIAVAIGLTLGTIIRPGIGSGVAAVSAAVPDTTGSWLDFIKGIVPANMLGIGASTTITDGAAKTGVSFNVLQILVVALAVGFAAVRTGEAGAPFVAFNASLLAIVRKILWWVIRLTPIGTAGLLGAAVVKYGWTALASLCWFAGAVYLGLGIVLFGVYPLILRANRLSPAAFFAGAWPAIQLGFVTRSSIGTLPVTEAVAERLGVPKSYAGFAVPLGATTKMDGCAAIYPAIAALFVAQYYGVALHASDYLLIAFVSVVGSAATAGLTGAVVMLTLTLSTLGLPLEGVGLLLAIDPILDMGRTATNVAGQALVPIVVAARAGILDLAAYNAARAVEAPLVPALA